MRAGCGMRTVLRQHGLAGLLDLKQQRVLVGALQQLQVAARADASHAHHATCQVGRLVLCEHGVDVDGHGVAVLGEEGVDRLGVLRAGDGRRLVEVEPHHRRRVLDEAQLAVGLALGGPADGAPRRATLGRGQCGIEHSSSVAAQLAARRFDVQVHEVAPRRTQPHHAAQHCDVLREGAMRDLLDILLRVAGLPPTHDDAGDEPFDVPLPRRDGRLVEIVQVEYELPLGRGEEAEVADVRVAARAPPRCPSAGRARGRAP